MGAISRTASHIVLTRITVCDPLPLSGDYGICYKDGLFSRRALPVTEDRRRFRGLWVRPLATPSLLARNDVAVSSEGRSQPMPLTDTPASVPPWPKAR